MSDEYNFQEELVKSVINADPKLDRHELLVDIFKAYVAKLFELKISRGDRMPLDVLVVVKRNLIHEFRKANLAEYQKSVEWYEDLFDKTVQEILSEAALRHKGQDSVSLADQTLGIHKKQYAASHDMKVAPSGLIVPG